MASKHPHTVGLVGSGTMVQKARLITGLTLMTYASIHFLNHALGHFSLQAMETGLAWQAFIWQSWPGIIALYGAFTVHITLGLIKIASLNTYRLPVWQWAQILLGLSIPFWLASHLVYTRFTEWELGVDINYTEELGLIWTGVVFQQTMLLLFVWAHGCIGVHFWLRLKDGYARWQPLLAAVAAFIPAVSITGWITAARRQAEETQAILLLGKTSQLTETELAASEQRLAIISYIISEISQWDKFAKNLVITAALILVAILLARYLAAKMRKKVAVTYGSGTRVLATPGISLLDVSRLASIPHMSVCGGRARCSTCRTLVIDGHDNLSNPTTAEKELLTKLNATPGIRLACQARLNGNVEIRPLIQPQQHISAPKNADPLGWGVERQIAVFFLDIRGFSRISEKSLPYDVVFILNSFFGEIAAEIESANGYIDKFMGDGLMALFGLSTTPHEACRDAMKAAINSIAASKRASKILTQHIHEPIQIGIGIHVGTAVVGRIGKTSDQSSPSRLTAIGDTVNVAARLESANKELGSSIVISDAVATFATIPQIEDMGNHTEIRVHNITKPIKVIALGQNDDLDKLNLNT